MSHDAFKNRTVQRIILKKVALNELSYYLFRANIYFEGTIMKALTVVKGYQAGAILTLEYVILMIGGAVGAVGLFILLGGKLPVIYDAWLNQVTFDASATFQGIETAACYQVLNGIAISSPQGYVNFSPRVTQTLSVDQAANPLCSSTNNVSVWSNYYQ